MEFFGYLHENLSQPSSAKLHLLRFKYKRAPRAASPMRTKLFKSNNLQQFQIN